MRLGLINSSRPLRAHRHPLPQHDRRAAATGPWVPRGSLGPQHSRSTALKNLNKIGLKVGWGGWTRTTTVLINSEVPYRLDHAPTGLQMSLTNLHESAP